MAPRQKPGKSKQDYATPWNFFYAVEKLLKIQFKWDLAAHSKNAKCSQFLSPQEDAFEQVWHKLRGWKWLNPPFGKLAPWAERCMEESRRGADIAMLVPAAVGSNWYRDFVYHQTRTLYINGRISFDGQAGYPKDCMLCLYSKREVIELHDRGVIIPWRDRRLPRIWTPGSAALKDAA